MKSRRNWLGAAVRTLAVTGTTVGFFGFLLTHSASAVWASGPSQANGATTYAQVAPILRSQCAGCHNPQGGAPFNLLTYDDAKQWGGQILDVTQSRYMPPWLPAPAKGDFEGARRLSDAELAAIRAWVAAETPPASGPDAPASTATPEWSLGKPDAVLTLTEPVELPGNGSDVFTDLVVPFAADSSHRLRAIQIRPSDPQAVRSVWVHFDENGKRKSHATNAHATDTIEPPEGSNDGHSGLVFWSPGSGVLKPRPGESWQTKPGGNLLLTTHLKTTGKKLALQMQIGLYYANGAPEGRAAVLRLQHQGAIEIPAGASSTIFEDSYTLPQAAAVTAIYPRAHFLARTFDAYATTPAGKQVWLLSIPKWDVDWLEVYAYRRPVLLAKGVVIHWKVAYDNSAENAHNPSDPPVAVHGGTGAKDEADSLLLEMLPPSGTDPVAWRRAFASPTQ